MLPGDPLADPGAQGLGNRFLGGKTFRQHILRPFAFPPALLLGFGEDALDKTIPVALPARQDPRHEKQIGADAPDHRRVAPTIRAFISCTAVCRPVKSARAIMAWPIFNSLIPGKAAMASTLW